MAPEPDTAKAPRRPKKAAGSTTKAVAARAKTVEAPTHLAITQVRSAIGSKPKHRGTLRALGLRRIGHRSVLPDRPEIRGMIARVPHLVTVTSAAPGESDEGARR